MTQKLTVTYPSAAHANTFLLVTIRQSKQEIKIFLNE